MTKMAKSIPETTHEFQVDVVGRITKQRFMGEFKCKIPTIKDQALIAKHNAMLNGDMPIYLESGVLKVHRQISYLRFTLIDVPKFWKDADLGYDLRDDNVIEAIYDEVMSFESDWLKEIWGDGEEEPKDGSAKTEK